MSSCWIIGIQFAVCWTYNLFRFDWQWERKKKIKLVKFITMLFNKLTKNWLDFIKIRWKSISSEIDRKLLIELMFNSIQFLQFFCESFFQIYSKEWRQEKELNYFKSGHFIWQKHLVRCNRINHKHNVHNGRRVSVLWNIQYQIRQPISLSLRLSFVVYLSSINLAWTDLIFTQFIAKIIFYVYVT